MDYQVKLTHYAIAQMKEAMSYISKVLMVPSVAKHWSARIKNELSSLSALPGRCPLVEEEPWHTAGIRKMLIENFLAYYWIDETEMTVWIIAIVYARRDQLRALQDIPLQF